MLRRPSHFRGLASESGDRWSPLAAPRFLSASRQLLRVIKKAPVITQGPFFSDSGTQTSATQILLLEFNEVVCAVDLAQELGVGFFGS